jgi:hypothetical protein
MTTLTNVEETADVPAQVFERFLQNLGDAGVSTEIVTRLRKVLLEEQTFTDRVLKSAVMGEDPLP